MLCGAWRRMLGSGFCLTDSKSLCVTRRGATGADIASRRSKVRVEQPSSIRGRLRVWIVRNIALVGYADADTSRVNRVSSHDLAPFPEPVCVKG